MQLLTQSIWSDANHHHRPHTQSWISVLDPPSKCSWQQEKQVQPQNFVCTTVTHIPSAAITILIFFFFAFFLLLGSNYHLDFLFLRLLSPPPDQYQMCTTVTHILLHHFYFICTITTTSISIWLFGITRPKPDYGQQCLDWIFGQEYSFRVLSTWKMKNQPGTTKKT